MVKEHWVETALTNDALVAELLLRLKQSSSSDSSHAPPPPTTATTTPTPLPPPGWGHRKNRSKPTAATATVTNGFRKEQRGSPTTHLSWSGGGGSTSDGYDEYSRPSDLSSGARSVKANEGASTSSYDQTKKRKSFAELKEEEGFLLTERVHLNKELESMRLSLHQQMATSEDLKRIKIDLDQNPKKQMGRTLDHEPLMKSSSLVNHSVQISCRVEAEIETQERGFVLPDLNMTPNEEDLAMMG